MDSNNDKAIVNFTTTKPSRKTIWDSSTHIAFLELCMDEVRKGNRPGSHFNRVGWANLIANLNERTGKSLCKAQLKNHWDTMKKDWKLYDRLMRKASGLGWDPVRKTIDATPEWWDETIKGDLELFKFKDKNLEMYHLYYEPLFRNFVARGDTTKPPLELQNDNISNDVEDEINHVDIEGKGDSDKVNLCDEEEALIPESSSSKRKNTQKIAPTRSKELKTSIASSFEQKLDIVLETLSSRSTQTFPPPNSTPSLKDCMDIVSAFPGFEQGSSWYNKALCIFMKKSARESFMFPPDNEAKIAFLKVLMEENFPFCVKNIGCK